MRSKTGAGQQIPWRTSFIRGARAAAVTVCAGIVLAQAAMALAPGGGERPSWRNSQGYLGVDLRDVSDEQVTVLKLKEARGAEIVVVDHDGPAFRSGLRMHDVVLEMNGQMVEGEAQIRRMLRETPAGRTVTFVISRDGQQQTITTQLADRRTVEQQAWDRHMTVPEPQPPESTWHGNGFFAGGGPSAGGGEMPRSHGFLGLGILSSSYTGALLEMLGPQLADYFGAESGLLVREVDANSPAAVAGMRAGDVVVKANAVAVLNPGDWLKIVHENRGKPIPVVVLRERKEQILTLTPDSKKRSSVTQRLWPGAKPHPETTLGWVQPPVRMQ